MVEERSCSWRSVATNLIDGLEHLSCDQKLVILSVPTGVESSRVTTSTLPLCLHPHWFLRPVFRLYVRVPELQTGLCAEAEMSEMLSVLQGAWVAAMIMWMTECRALLKSALSGSL